jgi:hypothetical protein
LTRRCSHPETYESFSFTSFSSTNLSSASENYSPMIVRRSNSGPTNPELCFPTLLEPLSISKNPRHD